MNIFCNTLITVTVGIFLYGFSLPAEAANLDADQQVFFNQFRYAVQAHDPSRIIDLTHSSSLACVADEDRGIYYEKLLDSLVRVMGELRDVQKLSSTPVIAGDADLSRDLPAGRKVRWPVQPEVQLVLHYDLHKRSEIASMHLAREEKEWKWVHVCVEQ